MIEILARDRSSRTQRCRVVAIHVNVGPDVEGGAFGVAHETQHQQGAYHEIVDDTEFIITAHDNEVVAGATGGNSYVYHICIIGDPRQSPNQWQDRYSASAMRIAAQRTAAACQRLGIPIQKIGVNELLRQGSGICGHVDITAYANAIHMQNNGHWDPGPNFPWALFIAEVKAAAGGADTTGGYVTQDVPPVDDEEEDQMVISPQRAVRHGRTATATLDAKGKQVLLWNGATVKGDIDARKMFGVRIWRVPCAPTEHPKWIKEHLDNRGFTVQCTNGATFDAYWH